MALLVGVAALVIDGGTLMEARRHVQAAADAAALAGAADLYANYPLNGGIDSGSAKASAVTAASDNDFVDGSQSSVIVNTAGGTYQGGPNAGQTIPPGYIEVLIRYNAPHLFSGVFGSGSSVVYARAVARGMCAPQIPSGLLALNVGLADALSVTSTSGLLSGPGGLKVNGSLQVNSGNSQAVSVSGNVQLAASQIMLNPSVGNLLSGILSFLSSLLGGGPPPAVTTSPAVPDPLRYLDPPQTGPLISRGTNLSYSSGIHPLLPGIYTGGIHVSGTAIVTLQSNPDGSPGIYYLDGPNGGLQISQSATVKMALGDTGGVMIYNNWSGNSDAIAVSGNGSLNLIPPASGIYRGLSIFQKRGTSSFAGPKVTVGGGGSINVTGTIYAAHAAVSFSVQILGNKLGGQIIADTVLTNGPVTIDIDSGGSPTANQRILQLVE